MDQWRKKEEKKSYFANHYKASECACTCANDWGAEISSFHTYPQTVPRLNKWLHNNRPYWSLQSVISLFTLWLQVKYLPLLPCKNQILRFQCGSTTGMREKLRAALPDELQTQTSITEKMVSDSHCEGSSCYWSAEDLITFLDDSLDSAAQAVLYKQGSWLNETPKTARPNPSKCVA